MEFHVQLRAKVLFSTRDRWGTVERTDFTFNAIEVRWATSSSLFVAVVVVVVVEAFEIDFVPMAFFSTRSTTYEYRVGISIKQRTAIMNTIAGSHAHIIVIICKHSEQSHYEYVQRMCLCLKGALAKWSSFRFFYAIINLFRITISAPKTQLPMRECNTTQSNQILSYAQHTIFIYFALFDNVLPVFILSLFIILP